MTGPAWVQAIATAVLVAITAYYAIETHGLASAARQAAEVQTAQRRRERAEAAAIAVLEVVREKPFWTSAGDEELNRQEAKGIWLACDAQVPLLDDREIKRRILSLKDIAFTAGWPDDALAREGTDRGSVTVKLRQAAEASRWSLEAFLNGDALPSWEELPEPTGALAWIVRPLGKEST
jgi:hypothetical protein